MEINVWIRWFVQVVNSVSNLLKLSNEEKATSFGASPAVPAGDAISTSTLKPSPTDGQGVLNIARKTRTADALFGEMRYNGQYLAVTMERIAVAIPVGTYRGYKRDSAHFDMRVVGIDVPNRTNIECHPANLPSQLEGCVAVGDTQDGDALDNSRDAFDRMMEALPEEFTVEVTSI